MKNITFFSPQLFSYSFKLVRATVHPTFAANKSKILLPTEQELTTDLADAQKMAER